MPLSPHVPDLAAMDMLLSVAQHGSMGRAAEEHGVTQPAVSSRIRRMERLLGVALIERTSQGSVLTGAGSLVVEWARDVVESAAALERGVEALRRQTQARLRVAASMTVAEYLMPTWLMTAHREDPGLAVALELANSTEVARRVTNGLVDLGYVEGLPRTNGLRTTTVARDELLVVVAGDHPWARPGVRVSARMLAETPLIQREPGSGTRWTLDRALQQTLGKVELAPPMLELTSTTAIKAAAQNGLAPAVISSLAVADALQLSHLVAVHVEGLDLRRALQAVWPAGRPLLGSARTFVGLSRRAHQQRRRPT